MPDPLVLSSDTIRNFTALETRSVPRRVFGRLTLMPRGGMRQPVFWRLLIEMGVIRYLVPLIPFPIIAILRPSLALPIAQAPLLMLIVIWLFETRVLGMSAEARDALLDTDEIDRRRDAFRANAQRALSRIAAARPDLAGEIVLVVEQSELARLPVLTLVSVQQQLPDRAVVLDLAPTERQAVLTRLFNGEFSAEELQEVTLATRQNVHMATLDTRSVSAHARLAALAV